MNPLKIGFLGAVLFSTAFFVVLISNLPTIFDIITVSVATIGGVFAGRKSTDWF